MSQKNKYDFLKKTTSFIFFKENILCEKLSSMLLIYAIFLAQSSP